MEGTCMKLLRLQVEKLYGHYNYHNIEFNQDVTFLYGLNGCGKTTILNITEAIITGQIYKLSDYEFEKIVLQYTPKDNMYNVHEIIIVQEENRLLITFEGELHTLEKNAESFKKSHGRAGDYERAQYYFGRYDILVQIKRMFNYVYLPLNRSYTVYDFDMEERMGSYHKSRNSYADGSFIEPFNGEQAMVQIERLIADSCSEISSKISQISDKFRNDVLRSSLDVNEQYADQDQLLNAIIRHEVNIYSIMQIKTAYINILKDLSLIDNDEEAHFVEFFDELYNDITQNNHDVSDTVLTLKLNEVLRVKKIVYLAEKAEEEKAIVRKPIEKFLETMNDFIAQGEDKKELKIDSRGKVYFITKYNKKPIGIQHLSSGEKQLITFFANLIFKVKNNTSGIFVVDEPELSLHLSWQKIFVEKTLEINSNIQLIFATHAPEIVGKNRDKMFKLVKTYVD